MSENEIDLIQVPWGVFVACLMNRKGPLIMQAKSVRHYSISTGESFGDILHLEIEPQYLLSLIRQVVDDGVST